MFACELIFLWWGLCMPNSISWRSEHFSWQKTYIVRASTEADLLRVARRINCAGFASCRIETKAVAGVWSAAWSFFWSPVSVSVFMTAYTGGAPAPARFYNNIKNHRRRGYYRGVV
jgi:hypothetical protein